MLKTSLSLLPCLFLPCAYAQQQLAPPLMLASNYQEHINVSSYWISEKYDGVRAYWDGQQLLSRSGHVITLPRSLHQALPQYALDMELWLGRGRFNELIALLNSHNTEDDPRWDDVRLMVFDLPLYNASYQLRYQQLQSLLPLHPQLNLVPYQQLSQLDDLQQYLASINESGGEGVILRDPTALYIAARSSALLKYKSYQDAEAQVIAYNSGKGKYKDKIGSLTVKDAQGRIFKLGSGLSDEQRLHPPAIGAWVNYRYNGLTRHGLPRFARFTYQVSPW